MSLEDKSPLPREGIDKPRRSQKIAVRNRKYVAKKIVWERHACIGRDDNLVHLN